MMPAQQPPRTHFRGRSRPVSTQPNSNRWVWRQGMLPENLDFLTLAYGFFNMLRLMSYAPQMALLVQDDSGAKAISVSSWLIWTGANFTTAIYAWVRLADVPLSLLNTFNTGCCATMLALLIYKRTTVGLGLWRVGVN